MYAKLFTSIYQGTLRGNSHGLLVFTNLIAHCDRYGEVDMHPRAIAEEVGLTVEQVRAALLLLESPDAESRSPELGGRRLQRLDEHRDWGWRVVNFCKYRAIRDEDDRREQNRQAQARFREKAAESKPASADVITGQPRKPMSAHTDADADADAEADASKPASKGKASRKRSAAPPARPPEVSEQVWDDWMALRAKKRAPVTVTVLKGAVSEAAKANMTLEAFLEVWCQRGSQGLEAAWLTPTERGSKRPGQPKTEALVSGNVAAVQRLMERERAKA